MNKHFGKTLKELRKQAGKTQREVVSEINQACIMDMHISQTYLSALERRPTVPAGRILTMVAAYYGVPESYFFVDKESELSNQERRLIRAWRQRNYAYILDMIARKLTQGTGRDDNPPLA